MAAAYIHPTAIVDEGAQVGEDCQIWHWTHVSSAADIGAHSRLGQNVFIGVGVKIGQRVKIQNNVSVYTGVTLADDVFCGPSVVFTNVLNPRSFIERKHEFRPTMVEQGASIGANATIICGHCIGEYALIGAGSVVTQNVPAYALMLGNPARQCAWVCRCGETLITTTETEAMCPSCQQRYTLTEHSCQLLSSL